MSRQTREKATENLVYLKERRWEQLAALVEFAEKDALPSLIHTDPALYRVLRQPITEFPLRGWSGRRLPYLARSMSTGTLILCWTLKAVAPRTRSATNWCPCVLIATRSQPSRSTHLMISLAGSP